MVSSVALAEEDFLTWFRATDGRPARLTQYPAKPWQTRPGICFKLAIRAFCLLYGEPSPGFIMHTQCATINAEPADDRPEWYSALNAVIYLLGRAVIVCIQWLPLPLVARMGRLGGGLIYHLDGRHRRVALKNLSMCFGHE